MIIPVYKPLGASSHQLAAAIGGLQNEKATHTGTLDPMAEGVLIVLTGEDRFKKAELSDVKKTYTFEILFGVSTDTHDFLGLPEQTIQRLPPEKELLLRVQNTVAQFVGPQSQLQPVFSAGRMLGKSMFEYGRAGIDTPMQKWNDVTVFSLEARQTSVMLTNTLLSEQARRVRKVLGPFRQEEINSAWMQHGPYFPKTMTMVLCTAEVSKRTYIRGLVRDISDMMGIPALAASIIRTRNGAYSTKECYTVEQVRQIITKENTFLV